MPQVLNSTNAIAGIGKLFSMGVAFWQHKKFVAAIAGAPDQQRLNLFKSYVDGWSDSSFVGFSLTLSILAQREKDPLQKEAIQFLGSCLDSVRSRTDIQAVEQSVEFYSNSQSGEGAFLQDDVDFINDLVFNKPKEDHAKILVDRLASFNKDRYDLFVKNLHTIQKATTETYTNHKKNELNFGRPYFEDRLDYFFAREKTGQKDPNFVRVCAEYEKSLAACVWAIEVTPRIWNTLGRQ